MSGEVITTAIEEAFDYLDAPPARLAFPDVPIPYSRPLEQFCLPNANTIAGARGAWSGAESDGRGRCARRS